MKKRPTDMQIRQGNLSPKSINMEARTVDVVLTTELAVPMWDWDRGSIDEVLRVEGMTVYTGEDYAPLIDSHNRSTCKNVIGSLTGFSTKQRADGLGEIWAKCSFSEDEESDKIFKKVQTGHLRSCSIGYAVTEKTFIDEGTTQTVLGKTYTGPINVVTKWTLKEGSFVPIPADKFAGVRAEPIAGVNSGDSTNSTDTEGNAMKDEKEKPDTKEIPATTKAEATTTAVVVDALTPEKRAEIAKAERERISQILMLGREAGLPEEEIAKATASDTQVDAFRKQAFEHLCASRKPIQTESAKVTRDQAESFRNGVTDALIFKSGKIKDFKPCDESKDYMSASLLGIVRCWLYNHGFNPGARDKYDLLNFYRDKVGGHRAWSGLTPDDLPHVFLNALNKTLLASYQLAPSTYQIWCEERDANDLRPHYLITSQGLARLGRVATGGEVVVENDFHDNQEVYTPHQFAKIVEVTDAAFINDDVDALIGIPADMAVAARMTVDDWVYYDLLETSGVGPTMHDTLALFHSTHANYTASSGAAPSVTTLNIGRAMIVNQTGPNGRVLNLKPKFLLHPPAIFGTVATLINSAYDPALNNDSANPYYKQLEPVEVPQLSAGVTVETEGGVTDTHSGSASAWYLWAEKGRGMSPIVGFVGGRTPTVVDERPIEYLGTSYRVSLNFGVGWPNYRGAYKTVGA